MAERPPHVAHYANNLTIGFNVAEFVLDFGQLYPAGEEATLAARIVTTPLYARAFAEVLADCIRRYEEEHGPIEANG